MWWKAKQAAVVMSTRIAPVAVSITTMRVPVAGFHRKLSMNGRPRSTNDSGLTTSGCTTITTCRSVTAKLCR